MEAVGDVVDYVSLHLYGATTQLTDGPDEYHAIVAQPQYFEQEIQEYSSLVTELVARNGTQQPLGLALDEWNIRHLEPADWPVPQPSDDGGTAERDIAGLATSSSVRVNRWSPRTLADALFYAGVFNSLHRASSLPVPVTMANTVNLVNANGVVVARPGGAIRAATFHVWDLYQNHLGPVALAADVRSPSRLASVRQGDDRDHTGAFQTRMATVADLDVSATQTDDGDSVRLAVINRHRSSPVRATLALNGRIDALPPHVAVKDLGADVDDVLASNSLSDPDRVAHRDRGLIELSDGGYDFPPHSITLLSSWPWTQEWKRRTCHLARPVSGIPLNPCRKPRTRSRSGAWSWPRCCWRWSCSSQIGSCRPDPEQSGRCRLWCSEAWRRSGLPRSRR